MSHCQFPIADFQSCLLTQAYLAIDSINWQSAIGNRKSFSEWLADPGCFPHIRESNADLEIMACSSSEPERNLRVCCWPRFQIIPSLVESPFHPFPNRHFDPIGTEFT
jgi:hypothetical protein